MTKTYKYHSYIQIIANCPPAICNEINTNAFRFIFENKNHPNNFKPVLLISPLRANNKPFDNSEIKCSGYALSFFDSLINASNLFINQSKRNKNFKNIVGDHVAEIHIECNDGKATEPSSKEIELGHFDFFEYINTNFYVNIKNVQKL